MASGIKVDPEVREVYEQVGSNVAKAKRYKYALFCVADDEKSIIVEEKFEDDGVFDDYDTIVSTKLCGDKPKFLAWDFRHGGTDTNPITTPILISMCPDNCKIRHKLIHGSSINGLKSALRNSPKFVEADCLSDITTAAIVEKFKLKKN